MPSKGFGVFGKICCHPLYIPIYIFRGGTSKNLWLAQGESITSPEKSYQTYIKIKSNNNIIIIYHILTIYIWAYIGHFLRNF
ncbi:hypothetical protein CPL00373_CDS0059 [Klebsiella phage MassiveIgloo]